MPLPLIWTEPADNILCRLRASGATWPEIAAIFRLNERTVRSRARRIGARAPDPAPRVPRIDLARPPLPAGDAASWGAITDGTLLAGAAYLIEGHDVGADA
jgi:hypothetical protein